MQSFTSLLLALAFSSKLESSTSFVLERTTFTTTMPTTKRKTTLLPSSSLTTPPATPVENVVVLKDAEAVGASHLSSSFVNMFSSIGLNYFYTQLNY